MILLLHSSDDKSTGGLAPPAEDGSALEAGEPPLLGGPGAIAGPGSGGVALVRGSVGEGAGVAPPWPPEAVAVAVAVDGDGLGFETDGEGEVVATAGLATSMVMPPEQYE
jgi:hypothetical protein